MDVTGQLYRGTHRKGGYMSRLFVRPACSLVTVRTEPTF